MPVVFLMPSGCAPPVPLITALSTPSIAMSAARSAMTNCSADGDAWRSSCSLTSVIAIAVFGVMLSWPSV
jgi:hypothetical protein